MLKINIVLLNKKTMSIPSNIVELQKQFEKLSAQAQKQIQRARELGIVLPAASTSSTSNTSSPPPPDGDNGDLISQEIEQAEAKAIEYFKSFKTYLVLGYKIYLNRMRLLLNLNSDDAQHLNFCVARSLNAFKPYVMGIDLEVNFLAKQTGRGERSDVTPLDNITAIDRISRCLRISRGEAERLMTKQTRGESTKLSMNDFLSRLSEVHVDILDEHSKQTWRLIDKQKARYVLSLDKLRSGWQLNPPTSRHLGMVIIQIFGIYASKVPALNPRVAQVSPIEIV